MHLYLSVLLVLVYLGLTKVNTHINILDGCAKGKVLYSHSVKWCFPMIYFWYNHSICIWQCVLGYIVCVCITAFYIVFLMNLLVLFRFYIEITSQLCARLYSVISSGTLCIAFASGEHFSWEWHHKLKKKASTIKISNSGISFALSWWRTEKQNCTCVNLHVQNFFLARSLVGVDC